MESVKWWPGKIRKIQKTLCCTVTLNNCVQLRPAGCGLTSHDKNKNWKATSIVLLFVNNSKESD